MLTCHRPILFHHPYCIILPSFLIFSHLFLMDPHQCPVRLTCAGSLRSLFEYFGSPSKIGPVFAPFLLFIWTPISVQCSWHVQVHLAAETLNPWSPPLTPRDPLFFLLHYFIGYDPKNAIEKGAMHCTAICTLGIFPIPESESQRV